METKHVFGGSVRTGTVQWMGGWGFLSIRTTVVFPASEHVSDWYGMWYLQRTKGHGRPSRQSASVKLLSFFILAPARLFWTGYLVPLTRCTKPDEEWLNEPSSNERCVVKAEETTQETHEGPKTLPIGDDW